MKTKEEIEVIVKELLNKFEEDNKLSIAEEALYRSGATHALQWEDEHSSKEQVVIPRWVVEKAFNALRLNYNTMVSEGFDGCLRRQTATSYNYMKLFLEKEHPTDNEIKRVALNYIDGEIDV